MRTLKLIPVAALAALLSGCAGIGHGAFHANPSAASEFEMCKTLVANAPDMDFANALRMELGRRGVAESSCPRIIRKRETAVAVGIAVGAAALAIAASKHHDVGVHVGVGTTIGTYPGDYDHPVTDADWAWDQFGDAAGRPIWACRGLQTGAVADSAQCSGKLLADNTWPGMGAPGR